MEMYDFFYQQLTTLKARTGILQWEKLNESKDPGKEIDEVISFMIDEVKKDPFSKVKPEVLQRVISRAVVEDKDFIGMNAKFVRRALASWWEVNGDRVLMALNEKEASVYEPVKLTPEQDEYVNTMLESYKRRLLSEPVGRSVPKLSDDEIKKEGAEWTSDLERKGSKYNNGITPEQYQMRRKMQRAASDFYKGRASYSGLQLFIVGEFEVFAESQQHADEIYQIAMNQ